MTPHEIEMCVLDCLQDDDVEDIAALLRVLNGKDDQSWKLSRGGPFSEEEVRFALAGLMDKGFVTPAAQLAPSFDGLRPIPRTIVGVSVPWSEVWFHLEPDGRKVLQAWWNAEGQAKYPINRK